VVVAALKGKDKRDVAIPQPVMAEIAYGIERLPRSRRKERVRERFALIRDEMTRTVWDDEVSDRFGIQRRSPGHGQPAPPRAHPRPENRGLDEAMSGGHAPSRGEKNRRLSTARHCWRRVTSSAHGGRR
jgi:predicted nucleic acid-binding protein